MNKEQEFLYSRMIWVPPPPNLPVSVARQYTVKNVCGFPVGSPLGFLEDARRVLRVYVYAHTPSFQYDNVFCSRYVVTLPPHHLFPELHKRYFR